MTFQTELHQVKPLPSLIMAAKDFQAHEMLFQLFAFCHSPMMIRAIRISSLSDVTNLLCKSSSCMFSAPRSFYNFW